MILGAVGGYRWQVKVHGSVVSLGLQQQRLGNRVRYDELQAACNAGPGTGYEAALKGMGGVEDETFATHGYMGGTGHLSLLLGRRCERMSLI